MIEVVADPILEGVVGGSLPESGTQEGPEVSTNKTWDITKEAQKERQKKAGIQLRIQMFGMRLRGNDTRRTKSISRTPLMTNRSVKGFQWNGPKRITKRPSNTVPELLVEGIQLLNKV